MIVLRTLSETQRPKTLNSITSSPQLRRDWSAFGSFAASFFCSIPAPFRRADRGGQCVAHKGGRSDKDRDRSGSTFRRTCRGPVGMNYPLLVAQQLGACGRNVAEHANADAGRKGRPKLACSLTPVVWISRPRTSVWIWSHSVLRAPPPDAMMRCTGMPRFSRTSRQSR